MATVNLHLSEELEQFVNSQVETGKFAGASGYIEALIARAKDGKDRLEALLIEGLESGDPIPLDAGEWASIRQDVKQRISNAQ